MIECMKYVPVNKGSLQGYATIYVPKWGIEIQSVGVFQKDNKRWINFPQKEYEKDGVKKYASYIRFKEKNHMDIFSEQVKKAIDAFVAKTHGQTHYPAEGDFNF